MPQSRSSDRSSRYSSSRSYKNPKRSAPVKQVITRIVKPLVEYESNNSSSSSNNSPVHFKEGRRNSSRSLSSQARIVVKTSSKKSNKQTTSARSVKETSRSRSSTSKITSSSRSRLRRDSVSPRRSKKTKTATRSRSRRRASSSDESMDGRRVQHPYDYGPGSYPTRSPNSYKSNFPPQVGPRDSSWEQPPYDRLRSPPHNFPPRAQSPGFSHSGGRPANQVIRRSPSHSPHFHGSGSPRRSDYHESRRFLDRDGRQFAPRSPQQSPSYNHGNSHSPPNTGFVYFRF